MANPRLTREILSAAIEGFEAQKKRIDAHIAELRGMFAPAAPETSAPPKKRRMSAAGRKAIAEAQRKRWAATRNTQEVPAKKAKHKLSAAGRKAISEAAKKRWAAKKAVPAKR